MGPKNGPNFRWSYGVLVYEMLVGRSPFNDADVRGKLVKLVKLVVEQAILFTYLFVY